MQKNIKQIKKQINIVQKDIEIVESEIFLLECTLTDLPYVLKKMNPNDIIPYLDNEIERLDELELLNELKIFQQQFLQNLQSTLNNLL